MKHKKKKKKLIAILVTHNSYFFQCGKKVASNLPDNNFFTTILFPKIDLFLVEHA